MAPADIPPPECRSISLGATRLTLVRDGEMLTPSGEGVYGAPASAGWVDYTPPDAHGNIAVMPHALLVRGPGGTALVDTGGENPVEVPGRRSDFLERLAGEGVSPGDVATVVLTHAHLDHVGYNTREVEGGWVPTFARADYFIQVVEADSMRAEDPARWDRYFSPVERAGRLRCVSLDAPAGGGLTCLATPGHTAGHQSVLVDCGEAGSAIYLGDLAVTKLHFENPTWSPEWCWSREAERRSKARIAELALETGALLVFGHDPHLSWGRIERRELGVAVVPWSG
jgi:glyoxylase-like metal-dependent hydrolase (beta-lactamase superfamily II)